jgi:alkaline phosphatase D
MQKSFILSIFFFSQLFIAQDVVYNERIQSLGFGSCNRTDLDTKIWKSIVDENLNAWIWLGDIVYTENQSMEDLALKYSLQKSLPAYKKLSKNAFVFGVWDDHDFGINDGGSFFEKKDQSRDLLFYFLDLSQNHPARTRSGAYQSYCFGEKAEKVCLYLLDVRYFKEEYEINSNPKQRYKINQGNLLGEEQWNWLEKELSKNNAVVNLFAGGIQLLSPEHPYEKWSNFPKAQQRFFDILSFYKIKNPIYLSGDRHIAEVSLKEIESNYFLYDITSSGLTHSYESLKEEHNPLRISPLITSLNFGTIHFDWDNRALSLKIHDETGEIQFIKNISIL